MRLFILMITIYYRYFIPKSCPNIKDQENNEGKCYDEVIKKKVSVCGTGTDLEGKVL